ncbi:MAG: APC family permease [Hyphomicrobium sp.]|nr:APC family permease [Hyphomicrobium sp.]
MLVVFAIQHRRHQRNGECTEVHWSCRDHSDVDRRCRSDSTGQIDWSNYTPLLPLKAAYAPEVGAWDDLLGGLWFLAVCLLPLSTYGFETAVCLYCRSSAIRRRIRSGRSSILACFACRCTALCRPRSRGVLGLEGMLATPIVDGSGVAEAMARMVGGGAFVTNLLVMMMILALMLSIMTAMAGSSRTLYQASVDGWLPRYLSHMNEHGAPTGAMWTDLDVNSGHPRHCPR